jgi:hypothetical protein
MILWAITAPAFIVVAWIVYTFIHAYMTETGSFWQRTLKAGKDSATIVLAKLGILVGLSVTVLDQVATAIGDPSLIGQVQPYLTAKTIGIGGAIICALFIWTRLRTLGKPQQ